MTSIDLAAVKDIGYLAENADRATLVQDTFGETTVGEAELHCLVAAAIIGQIPDGHCVTGVGLGPNQTMPAWMADPKFEHIRPSSSSSSSASQSQKPTPTSISLADSIRASPIPEATQQLILSALLEKVASVLLVPAEELDPKKSVTAYGLDSLVAIEVRNWIARECGASLQVLELLSSGSLEGLAGLIGRKSKFVGKVEGG